MSEAGIEPAAARPSGWRRAAPIIALLLLAPVISELLFGVTRVSTIYLIIPQVGTWGCAALLIRYAVRRRGGGLWRAVLLLGLALAVAEECVIQQTSLAPLVGADPAHPYGRAFGVNWVYFLWALGYESIWAVALPILTVELAFRQRRLEPWIGGRGAAVAGAAFILASFVAWYSWTQVAVPKVFHLPVYRPPLPHMLIALGAILALIAAALHVSGRARPQERRVGRAPAAWLPGVFAAALGTGWTGLVLIAYGAVPSLPAAVPIAGAIGAAATAFVLIRHWSAGAGWGDGHRFAVALGAIVGSMVGGFGMMQAAAAAPVDIIGKAVLNVAAVLILIRLGLRVAGASGVTH